MPHHRDSQKDPFQKYEEFQEHRFDYGGRVPQFQYASSGPPSRLMGRSARFVGLVVLSGIILLVGIATERYVVLSILGIIALWIVADLLSRRHHKKHRINHEHRE